MINLIEDLPGNLVRCLHKMPILKSNAQTSPYRAAFWEEMLYQGPLALYNLANKQWDLRQQENIHFHFLPCFCLSVSMSKLNILSKMVQTVLLGLFSLMSPETEFNLESH